MNITYALVNAGGPLLVFECSSCGIISDDETASTTELATMALSHHRFEHTGHVAWLLLTPGAVGSYNIVKAPEVITKT